MEKKFLSIIIVPHHKGKHKTLSFSKRKIKYLTAAGVFLSLLMTAFFVDYFTMNVTRRKYKELYTENQQQRQQIASYEDSINRLNATIDNFEKYAKKLNIMAGLKSMDVLDMEPGIGSGSTDPDINAGSIPQNLTLDNIKDISQKADGVEKNLNTLINFFEDQSLKLAATPTIWPTKGWVTSPYGWRTDPFTQKRAFHWGIDIATHFGNPVLATADGVVIQTKNEKIGGKTIKISHRGGYTTVYCHLSKILVRPGQKIKRGETIGLIGKTGKALGPHLHYEVRLNGKSLNPYYYILEE